MKSNPNDQFLAGSSLVADRASLYLCDIWSPETKVILERQFWLEVMRNQRSLGLEAVSGAAIEAYRGVVDRQGWGAVDLGSIYRRELETWHDVKARLEEFNALAGHQVAHLGMTGRDLDDNVELYQQKWSLRYLGQTLREAGREAAARDIQALAARVPFRGLWGAVGTGVDQIQLLGGDGGPEEGKRKLEELNERLAAAFDFPKSAILQAVGQVYPRSWDFQMASSLTAILCAALAGRPRSWSVLMRGYVAMLAELAGDQWNEGDVSCSSVRRVALPSLFQTASAWVNEATDSAQEGEGS